MFEQFLVAVAIALISGYGLYLITNPKSNVHWSSPYEHMFNTTAGGTPISIYTKQYWLKNAGRGTAKDIEIILNFRPEHYDIWPTLPYEEEDLPDKRFVIRIRSLGRKEIVTCDLLGLRELPMLTLVRADGVERSEYSMEFGYTPTWWAYLISFGLMGTGFLTIVFLLVRFLWPY